MPPRFSCVFSERVMYSGEIFRVYPGTLAEEIGLSVGDKILTVNGEEIRDIIDFSFAFAEEDGESIGAVQERNIEALNEILEKYDGKNIVIGTHGTALSSIINYYDKTFSGESFMKIIDFMPWILKMEFDGKKFLCKEDIFHIQKEYKE